MVSRHSVRRHHAATAAAQVVALSTLLMAIPPTAFAGFPFTSRAPVPGPFRVPPPPGVFAIRGDDDIEHLGPVVPPAPCHPNSSAVLDIIAVQNRGDIVHLPDPLRQRLIALAARPHSVLPVQARAEADKPSQLFQYFLLDTHGFEPNVFTAIFPGVNDQVMLTATGPDCGLPTIGAVRLVLEPKPDLPTDPADPRAFIDVFTDLEGLFVINNESGWYEGWMIHDLTVPEVADGRADDPAHAQFGKLLQADADQLAAMGSGHNRPGQLFTSDGNNAHFPSATDHFPDVQTNLVPIQLSMGAYNSLQQSDSHAYWEFNYTTNWIHPLYELPFTGGIPGTFEAGKIGALQSIVPGPGPNGAPNDPVKFGDNPFLPRDPDKFDGDDDAQREFRMRFIPSGLANEVLLDTFERLASFEPGTPFPDRLFDAYKIEVARVDQDGDGVISAVEGDVDTPSDGFEDNARLFLSATSYDRFAVTREINDGLLAPRFAPSQKAWVLSGFAQHVSPAVAASAGRDSDDR
jgi:hypothetical protein